MMPRRALFVAVDETLPELTFGHAEYWNRRLVMVFLTIFVPMAIGSVKSSEMATVEVSFHFAFALSV